MIKVFSVLLICILLVTCSPLLDPDGSDIEAKLFHFCRFSFLNFFHLVVCAFLLVA